MTQIVSSISGIEIYAPSAGNAPTNSSEVSAIASAYQVVSATATQLYAGTSFLTSVNSAPVSASRAGNAANASMANSAYYDGTGRLISALPDRAAVSSIASGYVTGVSATVANNSASWGGGGGSVVSPSGTIFVSGSNIEGTNSAVLLQQTAAGFIQYLEKIYSLSEIAPYLQEITYNQVDDTGANLRMEFNETAHYPITILISGRDSLYATQSASSLVSIGESAASIPLGPIVQGISASASEYLHFPGGFQYFTAEKAGESGIVGVGELAWQSALTGVSSTVANNSASWGQGGVPASTVSSIASSYAESAASSKLDISLIGSGNKAVAPSGEAKSVVSAIDGKTLMPIYLRDNTTQFNNSNSASFYYMPSASPWTTAGAATGVFSPLQYSTGACLAMDNGSFKSYFKGNEWFVANTTIGMVRGELHASRGIRVAGSSTNSASGFQIHPSGVNGKAGSTWQYGTAEYEMLTSVNDTVSANSASWGGVDSATVSSIASSYAQDVSAAVSGTVDTVSSQSANWGGSALALSAGPGVKLEKVGDTLVVSTDETLLWSGEMSVGDTAEMAAPLSSFERVKITWRDWSAYRGFHVSEVDPLTTMYALLGTWYGNSTGITLFRLNVSASPDYSKIAFANGMFAHMTGSDYTATTNSLITKVVGVNRTAGV